MFIFRHEDGSKIASPEQMQIWMKQTMDWIGSIAAQNKFVVGTGLPMDDSRVVWHNHVVTNGPFGEIKGNHRRGYIVVKADSIEEARSNSQRAARCCRAMGIASRYGRSKDIGHRGSPACFTGAPSLHGIPTIDPPSVPVGIPQDRLRAGTAFWLRSPGNSLRHRQRNLSDGSPDLATQGSAGKPGRLALPCRIQ